MWSSDKWWQASADGFYFRSLLKFFKINERLFDELKSRVLDDEALRDYAEEMMIFDWGENEIPTLEEEATYMKVVHYHNYQEGVRSLFGRKKGYRTLNRANKNLKFVGAITILLYFLF